MARPSRSSIYLLVVLGLISILVAGSAEYHLGLLPDPDISIENHHIQHLFFVIGGGLWGLALARILAQGGRVRERQSAWLIPAILAPVAVMFVMWPSTYPYLEAHPLVHLLEHSVLVVLGALTTFAGYQYAQAAGWLFGASVVAMSWAAAYGYGVTPGPNPLLTANAAPPAVAAASGGASGGALGSVTSGGAQAAAGGFDWQQVGASTYNNCAACHQANGQGVPGAFPPLAGSLPDIYNAQGGRIVLIHTVLFGLQGKISAGGKSFNSTMPPQKQLSDEQVAAVLDHELTSWGNGKQVKNFKPIQPSEVKAERSKNLTPQQVYQERQKLDVP